MMEQQEPGLEPELELESEKERYDAVDMQERSSLLREYHDGSSGGGGGDGV